jgi:hypothetical protein
VVNVNDRGARLANTRVVHPAALGLPDPVVAKAPRLRALAPPPESDDPAVDAALLRLAQVGFRHSAAIAALAKGESSPVADVVGGLRVLFSDQAFAKVMGAFALKIVPLLLPPTDRDPAAWVRLVQELSELVALAEEAVLAAEELAPGPMSGLA